VEKSGYVYDKGCGCGVTRTLTMKTLGDPEKFPKRMENGDFSLPVGGQKKEWRQMANGKEPTCEKPDMLNRGTSLVCQLCRALEVEDCDGTIYTGRKSGLVHCKDCRLVLCQHACWQNFHFGLGLFCWIDRGIPQHLSEKTDDIKCRWEKGKRRKTDGFTKVHA